MNPLRFYGKVVARNRPIENQITFLRQFFNFTVPFPAFPLAAPIFYATKWINKISRDFDCGKTKYGSGVVRTFFDRGPIQAITAHCRGTWVRIPLEGKIGSLADIQIIFLKKMVMSSPLVGNLDIIGLTYQQAFNYQIQFEIST